MIIIICGVSGCGKSTVAKQLANQLNGVFKDADDYHSKENIEKMSKGISLTDDDRLEWLITLRKLIIDWETNMRNDFMRKHYVLACSALKTYYREILSGKYDDKITNRLHFILLHGEKNVFEQRLANRKDHFMPISLIQSQLDCLELPDQSETNMAVVDCNHAVKLLTSKIFQIMQFEMNC